MIRKPVLLVPLFLLSIFLFPLSSCRPEEDPAAPDLPPTPILTAESQWGVVNRPYLRVLESADSASAVNGLLRRGDIVEVLSKRAVGDGRSYWLEVHSGENAISGWVPDNDLNVYDSPEQAKTASGEAERTN